MVLPDFTNLLLGITEASAVISPESWVTPLAKILTGQVLGKTCPQPWAPVVTFPAPIKEYFSPVHRPCFYLYINLINDTPAMAI